MSLELTTSSLVLVVLAGLATLYVCIQSCTRSGARPATIAMELLRFTLVALAAFTLLQPSVSVASEPEGQSVVSVLYDDSGSMSTRDVERDGKLIERFDATSAIREPETWAQDQGDNTIEIVGFGAPRTDQSAGSAVRVPASAGEGGAGATTGGLRPYIQSATDIHDALNRIAEHPGEVRAVVLASDGDWNSGPSPAKAARKLRQLGIPVHTVSVGSPVALPDLAITQFDLPTFAIVGKPLRIPFAVTSTLSTPVDVDLTVHLPGETERTVSLQVPAGGTTESLVSWRPGKVGSYEISLSLPKHPDERVLTNNQETAPINVRHESLRVLMIESYPRWEYRYTRNALMRDPGVSVSTLLLHPDVPGTGSGPGYLNGFPEPEELAQYDAIFLGDVGIGEDQLTEENCQALVRHVSSQAAGLIFLPGFRGLQSTLQDSSIEELMPVEMDRAQPKGIRSATAGTFELTESGAKSLLVRLETTPEQNTRAWKALPGFFWHAAVQRAKPNTNTLAVHSSKSNRFGRLPMIVTRTFGAGKILFVGTDSAWRWRKGIEDLYHYRFWSQMVRWMSYQRTMSSRDSMRLIFTPDRPRAGSIVNVLVNAMDANGEPLSKGTVTTQVIMPSGRLETLNLKSDSHQAWGVFRGSFMADEGGSLRLITSCRETRAELETAINVRGTPRERTGQPARLDVLQEIASVTNGKTVNIQEGDLTSIYDAVRNLPPPMAIQQHYTLWNHPLWGLLLIVLLGVFWGLRKIQGMI